MAQTASLTDKAALAALEARRLTESLYPLVLPKKGLLPFYLTRTDRIVGKTLAILQELQKSAPARTLDQLMSRLVLYLLALTVGVSFVWWMGYYLVKRALAKSQPVPDLQSPGTSGSKAA
jgi:hypothetical protein